MSKPSDPNDCSNNISVQNGRLVITPKVQAVKITDIQKWTDAILIFSSIYQLTRNVLLAFSSASRTNGLGWLNYDIQFQLKKDILICHGMTSIRNYVFYICTVVTLILYKHHPLFSPINAMITIIKVFVQKPLVLIFMSVYNVHKGILVLNVNLLFLIMLALGLELHNQSNLLPQVLQLIDPALKFENQFQEIEYRAKTPVKHWVLRKMLKLYNSHDAEILYDVFFSGFRINYDGPRYATECKKLKPAFLFEHEELKTIVKENNWPFLYKPFSNLRISPIALVPKHDGSRRLIHHLSYPKGSSVNDYIVEKYCSVKYTSFETALSMLASFGRAFRLLPIHPSDFELLGYKICNLYFIDECLLLGCSISCLRNFPHLRNGIISKSPSNEYYQSMTLFTNICNELYVPLAHEKTIVPSPMLTFLGLEIDTNEMCAKIPPEKLSRLKHSLQELLGKKAIPSARAFNRRFYDAMTGLSKPFHRIRVNVEMKEDI
ncbi:hypothetical protein KUTeg_015777 [Tegillarca granosa]|uniref:Uncharacterized protein n=1 Tax=Tegillarca granosa TaxID=220873 RepID=A0ABQ9EQV1_TEGGR|nr:hypothetical protein KUTeg_015777 [Tegillarca granosa]